MRWPWQRRPPRAGEVRWFLNVDSKGGVLPEQVYAVLYNDGGTCAFLTVDFPDTGAPRLGDWVPRASASLPEDLGCIRLGTPWVQQNLPGLYGLVDALTRSRPTGW